MVVDFSLHFLDRFRQAAMAIKEEFGLSLFGFDVIVPRRSSHGHCSLTCHGDDSCVCDNKNHKNTSSHGDTISNRCENSSIFSHNIPQIKIDNGINSVSTNSDTVRTKYSIPSSIDIDDLVVIDVNYFPSYKEVPDFPKRLRRFFRSKAGMF
jgi:hypothetical protein